MPLELATMKVDETMKRNLCWITIVAVAIPLTGCRAKYREDLDYTHSVEQVLSLDEFLSEQMVQFESVWWDSDDTAELRLMITEEKAAAGRKVLEIGTGTGVIAVLCLQYGAIQIVATDANPASIANASYNAATVELDSNLDVRQVDAESVGTFAKVRSDERFGLIILNPGVEFDSESSTAKINSFLDRLPDHLMSGGRCIVACRQTEQITRWKSGSEDRGYELTILGDREFDPTEVEVFPVVLLEIRVPTEQLSDAMAPGETD